MTTSALSGFNSGAAPAIIEISVCDSVTIRETGDPPKVILAIRVVLGQSA